MKGWLALVPVVAVMLAGCDACCPKKVAVCPAPCPPVQATDVGCATAGCATCLPADGGICQSCITGWTGPQQGAQAGEFANGAAAQEQRFTAQLSGDQMSPAVDSAGSGTVTLTVRNGAIQYAVTLTGLTKVTSVHIHQGARGESGSRLATLFEPPSPTNSVSGQVAQGALGKDRIANGRDVADIIRMIREGNAYVLVRTSDHPDGELRGQLR